MSWKDYLYFTKAQKIGILILIFLIFLAVITMRIMPRFLQKEISITGDSLFLAEIESFQSSLVELEKEKSQKWKKRRYKNSFLKQSKNKQKTHYQLFKFNPNTADSVSLCQLGIKPYIVKNILKYRRKGGKFYNAKGFSRIYGLSKSKFNELEPYIEIEKKAIEKDTLLSIKRSKDTTIQKQTVILKPIELNSADTAQLIKIKGIGKYTANAILYYRKRLGGYVSVQQIKEIKRIRPENIEKIIKFFVVDTSKITKINVNKATVEQLKRHPYIFYFTKAKAIYDYRRDKIKLHNIEELEVLDELTPNDIKRLKPYLKFD